MKIKYLMTAVMIVLILGVVTGEIAWSQGRIELTNESAALLLQKRFFFSKGIRFCWQEAGGSVCNDEDPNNSGSVYLTDVGIIHKGEKCYLVRWQDIKKIDSKPGSPDIICLYTAQVSDGLILADPKSTGSINTLDTSLDILLRHLKKSFKKYKSFPAQPLPGHSLTTGPIPVQPVQVAPPPVLPVKASPPCEPVKPATPTTPETKEISVGMTFTEVEKVLGAPLQRINLADKVIYRYSDLVITFIDGKIKDVEVK